MMTTQFSASCGPIAPGPGEAVESERLLQLATALRQSARRSSEDVIALGERIAGYRALPQRPTAPLQRWLEMHGQAGPRAMARAAEAGPALAGLVLCTELTRCWFEANLTLVETLVTRPRP